MPFDAEYAIYHKSPKDGAILINIYRDMREIISPLWIGRMQPQDFFLSSESWLAIEIYNGKSIILY